MIKGPSKTLWPNQAKNKLAKSSVPFLCPSLAVQSTMAQCQAHRRENTLGARDQKRENTPGAALERLTDLVKIGEGCVRLVATFERADDFVGGNQRVRAARDHPPRSPD